jgi:hypothetical protein
MAEFTNRKTGTPYVRDRTSQPVEHLPGEDLNY